MQCHRHESLRKFGLFRFARTSAAFFSNHHGKTRFGLDPRELDGLEKLMANFLFFPRLLISRAGRLIGSSHPPQWVRFQISNSLAQHSHELKLTPPHLFEDERQMGVKVKSQLSTQIEVDLGLLPLDHTMSVAIEDAARQKRKTAAFPEESAGAGVNGSSSVVGLMMPGAVHRCSAIWYACGNLHSNVQRQRQRGATNHQSTFPFHHFHPQFCCRCAFVWQCKL